MTNRPIAPIFALLCSAWFVAGLQVDHALAEPPLKFSVISYNVQFLPPPASIANRRKQPDYRAGRIAAEVSQFDIIGLQETFHEKHRDQIIDGLESAWNQPPNLLVAPRPDGFTTGGGTLLLTQRPITLKNSVVFQNYSKPADYGFMADGFAAKGVIHGRVVLSDQNPDRSIDVYVTHLEARDGKLRPKQYAEMAKFIQQTSDPKRPLILMGDMNTRGMTENRRDPNSQYHQLLAALNNARPGGGVTDVWVALQGDALGGTSDQESAEIGKRIDYIFVGNPQRPLPQLVPKSIAVETYRDDKVYALSDHNAVVAEFEWVD